MTSSRAPAASGSRSCARLSHHERGADARTRVSVGDKRARERISLMDLPGSRVGPLGSAQRTMPLAQVVSRVSAARHHLAEAGHAARDAAAHASRGHARVVPASRRVDHVDVDRVAPALDGATRWRAEHVHVVPTKDLPLGRELVEPRRDRASPVREQVRRRAVPSDLAPPKVIGQHEEDMRLDRRSVRTRVRVVRLHSEHRCRCREHRGRCERRRRRQLGREWARWLEHLLRRRKLA